MFTWKHKNICSAGEPLYRTIQLSDQNQSRRSQGPVSCQTKTIYPSRKRRYEDPVKPRTCFGLLHPESSGKDIKRASALLWNEVLSQGNETKKINIVSVWMLHLAKKVSCPKDPRRGYRLGQTPSETPNTARCLFWPFLHRMWPPALVWQLCNSRPDAGLPMPRS